MLIKLRKMMTNQKGFTLVELLVVIAILGVLAAVAVPKFANSTNAAKDAALKANLRTVDSALMQYYATNNSFPATGKDAAITALVPAYLAGWPTDAAGTATANELSYTLGTGTSAGTYILTGVNSAGAVKSSPGSSNYSAW